MLFNYLVFYEHVNVLFVLFYIHYTEILLVFDEQNVYRYLILQNYYNAYKWIYRVYIKYYETFQISVLDKKYLNNEWCKNQ